MSGSVSHSVASGDVQGVLLIGGHVICKKCGRYQVFMNISSSSAEIAANLRKGGWRKENNRWVCRNCSSSKKRIR